MLHFRKSLMTPQTEHGGFSALRRDDRSEWDRARQRRSHATASAAIRPLLDGGLLRTDRMARLEAALLIAEGPAAAKKLVHAANLADPAEVRQLTVILNEHYDRSRSAFRIEETAAGFVLMTRASLAPWLDRLHQRQALLRLSPPMLETLTSGAYQQPVTRADVEAIRGVQSAEMIRQLLDRQLIRIAGEDDSLGRPFLYETTRQFLAAYGLRQLTDLPAWETLRRQRTLPAIAETGADNDAEADANSADVSAA
jgi:segregation and condensation protein B